MLKDKIEIRTAPDRSVVAKLDRPGRCVDIAGTGSLSFAQTKTLAAWLGAAAVELAAPKAEG